jgi:hypothetical protein
VSKRKKANTAHRHRRVRDSREQTRRRSTGRALIRLSKTRTRTHEEHAHLYSSRFSRSTAYCTATAPGSSARSLPPPTLVTRHVSDSNCNRQAQHTHYRSRAAARTTVLGGRACAGHSSGQAFRPASERITANTETRARRIVEFPAARAAGAMLSDAPDAAARALLVSTRSRLTGTSKPWVACRMTDRKAARKRYSPARGSIRYATKRAAGCLSCICVYQYVGSPIAHRPAPRPSATRSQGVMVRSGGRERMCAWRRAISADRCQCPAFSRRRS